MSNRLQVGGLALVVGGLEGNLGRVVKLIKFVGKIDNPFSNSNDCWLVIADNLVGRMPNGIIKPVSKMNVSAKYLLPLGDQKGVEMFELEKEIENESTAKI